MNYTVVSLLCAQFDKLNEDFSKCIGDRGQFEGNFEHFRRRHHGICCSVQAADRFLMISNVGCFGFQIVNIIVVLYTVIFYRDDVISPDSLTAAVYITWLGSNVFGLALVIVQGMMLNHKASFINSRKKIKIMLMNE